MTEVKICGINDAKIAEAIAKLEFKPDYAGLVFAESKRQVSLEQACELSDYFGDIGKVGVFVNEKPERVWEIATKVPLDVVQLHGNESREYCEYFKNLREYCEVWKAFDENNFCRIFDYKGVISAAVVDAFVKGERGGTGKVVDWEKARLARGFGIPMFLAGGLTPQNVGEAIRTVGPYGVDTSSGVEVSKGVKDIEKIADFIRQVRGAA